MKKKDVIHLIQQDEQQDIELKEGFSAKELGKTACAFAITFLF